MKKMYTNPRITVVKLQHQTQLMQTSGVRGVTGGDVDYGGASSNNTSGSVRTKESGSIWDEEW